jgi:uncharacterized protein (DUF885 family)
VKSGTKRGIAHSTWAESGRVLDDLRLLLMDSIAPARRGLVARAAPTPKASTAAAVWVLPAGKAPAAMGGGQDPKASPAPPRCVLP